MVPPTAERGDKQSTTLRLYTLAAGVMSLRQCTLQLAFNSGVRKRARGCAWQPLPRVISAPPAPTAIGDRDRVGTMRVLNGSAPKGLQCRSKLKKGMHDWFEKGEATTNKCVLCIG